MRLIDRYLLRELWPLVLLAFGVTTGLFFLDKLLWLTSLILRNHLDLGMSWRLLWYTLPTVSGVTLPIDFLIGCTLMFTRLSTDNEYLMLQSAGLSVYRLLRPIVAVAGIAYIFSGLIFMYVSPWGFQGLQQLLFDIVRQRAHYHLRAGEFNDTFKDIALYVERTYPEAQRLEGIFIADARSAPPRVLTAREGEVYLHPDALLVVLRLHHGTLHHYAAADARYRLIRFKQYEIVLNLDTPLARKAGSSRPARELFPAQLRAEIARLAQHGEDTRRLRLFWHKLFALPFACLIFAGLGPVLGVMHSRSGRSGGYVLSVGGIFVYYIFLAASDALGEETALPPLLAAWLPNLCMGGITLLLLRRTARGAIQFDAAVLWRWPQRVWRSWQRRPH